MGTVTTIADRRYAIGTTADKKDAIGSMANKDIEGGVTEEST